MHLAGDQFPARLDSTPQQGGLAGRNRAIGESGRPQVGGHLDSLRLAIKPLLSVGGDVDWFGVVDGLQVAPRECSNGRGAVVGDEAHGGVAGRVVKVDDGADVVAVECSNPSVWQEVAVTDVEVANQRNKPVDHKQRDERCDAVAISTPTSGGEGALAATVFR